MTPNEHYNHSAPIRHDHKTQDRSHERTDTASDTRHSPTIEEHHVSLLIRVCWKVLAGCNPIYIDFFVCWEFDGSVRWILLFWDIWNIRLPLLRS